jgi:hypothetical protein
LLLSYLSSTPHLPPLAATAPSLPKRMDRIEGTWRLYSAKFLKDVCYSTFQ